MILLKPNRVNQHIQLYRLNEWGKEQMKKQTFDRIKKILAVLLVLIFIASLTAGSVSAKKEKVKIKNSAFDPGSIKIKAGDTVKWTNKDSIDHTVAGSTFKSGVIHKGKSFVSNLLHLESITITVQFIQI